LEEAGARILFGISGLKVHCKLALITRKQKGKTAHCACVSTGNFHEGNSKVYTDTILFTSDSRITRDVDKVFDYFENTYKFPSYQHLLVSPHYMRRKFMALIQKEIDFANKGKEAWIMIKVNSLVDVGMIKKLYQASAAGVKIRMIIRGICSLIPGVPGLSENIEVVSVVDKFLEHSRIFIFNNGGEEKYYISSADWMSRNLDSRVEVACPVFDPAIQKDLKMIIEEGLNDNVKARIINIAQDNPYRIRAEGEPERHSQEILYDYYKALSKQHLKS
jgi:polyphosphate kinase